MVLIDDPHELKIIHTTCRKYLEFHYFGRKDHLIYKCPKCKRIWTKDFITGEEDSELLIFRTAKWEQLKRENRRRGYHK